MTRIILLLLTASFLHSSCTKTCDSVKVGDIPPPTRFDDFSVYQAREVVSFENADGEQIVFRAEILKMEGRVNLREIGIGRDPQDGSFACYQYLSTSWVNTQLLEPTEGSVVVMNVFANGELPEALEYWADLGVGWNEDTETGQVSGWTQSAYNFTKDEFVIYAHSTVVAEKLDTWEAHGKTFDNVLKFKSDTGEFYFVEGIGLVGFTRIENTLYSLVL